MDELDKLVEQVKILRDTNEAMLARQEQLFRMQEERLNAFLEKFPAIETRLQQAAEEIETTDEALKESLSDSDQQLDDLVKAVAAILMVQKNMQASEQ